MDPCLPIWHPWAWEEMELMMALELGSIMAVATRHCQLDLACKAPVEGELPVGSVVATHWGLP